MKNEVRLIRVPTKSGVSDRLGIYTTRHSGLSRKLDNCRWDKEERCWTAPPEEIVRLLQIAPDIAGHSSSHHVLRLGKNVLKARELTTEALRSGELREELWTGGLVPFKHQRDGMTFIADSLASALWHDTGLGKTISGGMWLCRLLGDDPLLRKAWVICPKDPDRDGLDPRPEEPVWWAAGHQRTRHSEQAARGDPRVGLEKRARRRALQLRNDPRGPRAARAAPRRRGDLRRVLEDAERRQPVISVDVLVLQAVPRDPHALRHAGAELPSEYFGYTKIVEQVSGFRCFEAPSKKQWDREWFWRGDSGHLLLLPNKKEEFFDRMKPVFQWVRRHEATDIPPSVDYHIEIPMGAKAWDRYLKIEADLRAAREEDEVLQAFAKMMRLRQITSGFYPKNRRAWLDGEKTEMIDMDHGKDEWCSMFGKNNINERFVIWTQFHYETDRLCQRLRKDGITADIVDGRTKKPEEVVRRFKAGDFQAIIMHPRKAQFGISLPGVGYSVFHSCSHSFEEFSQGKARIEGLGRGKEGVASTNYILRATSPHGMGSIDHAISDTMKRKFSQSEALFAMDRLRREHEAKGVP